MPRGRLAIALLGLAGMGISAYLTYVHWSLAEPFCAGGEGCALVDASPYSEVLGVPVALLGFLMYAAIFGLALSLEGKLGGLAPALIFSLALAGTLYSAYLTYLELFVIYAICLWCVASALVITAILALSLRMALARG